MKAVCFFAGALVLGWLSVAVAQVWDRLDARG